MKRDQLNDVAAFVVLAGERNFTRAASKLGMSRSGLSHAMRALENRLGVRLLTRTTRSVALTDAGQRWLNIVGPAIAEIDAGFLELGELRQKPAGMIRIRTFKEAARSVLWPVLGDFLDDCPEIVAEIAADSDMTDLIGNRFDAGITFGSRIPHDMVAVRVSPDIEMSVVARADYFDARPRPATPHDLAGHRCINYRLHAGGFLPWEFESGGTSFEVKVNGPLIVNDVEFALSAVLQGRGIGYGFKHIFEDEVRAGRMVYLLEEWCPAKPGLFLYHPSRRHVPPALARLIELLVQRRDTHW